MKILMLTWEYPPNLVGGLSRHVEGLAKGLRELGVEIHIITTWIPGIKAYEKEGTIEIFRVKPIYEDSNFLHWVAGLNVAMVSQVLNLARHHQYHVIHAHDWLVGAAATTIKKELELPLFTTVHATEYGRNQGIHTELQKKIHQHEQRLVDASNLIISCSPYMTEEIKKTFSIPQEKIVMIPNGIETTQKSKLDYREILNRFPLHPSKSMVFSIGRMVREKGFETLIEAAQIVSLTRNNLYFIIAGKGPMLEELKQKSYQLGLDNIHFVGFVSEEERETLLSFCDIAVFPSIYEPFGIVALESLAHEKPTIVSEVGGLKGIIDPLHTGLYMQPGDANDLVEQLYQLLDSPTLMTKIAKNGKKMVDEKYSWKRIAEHTKEIFDLYLFKKQ